MITKIVISLNIIIMCLLNLGVALYIHSSSSSLAGWACATLGWSSALISRMKYE